MVGFPSAKAGIGAIPFEFRVTSPDTLRGDFVVSDFSLEMAKVAIMEKIIKNNFLIFNCLEY